MNWAELSRIVKSILEPQNFREVKTNAFVQSTQHGENRMRFRPSSQAHPDALTITVELEIWLSKVNALLENPLATGDDSANDEAPMFVDAVTFAKSFETLIHTKSQSLHVNAWDDTRAILDEIDSMLGSILYYFSEFSCTTAVLFVLEHDFPSGHHLAPDISRRSQIAVALAFLLRGSLGAAKVARAKRELLLAAGEHGAGLQQFDRLVASLELDLFSPESQIEAPPQEFSEATQAALRSCRWFPARKVDVSKWRTILDADDDDAEEVQMFPAAEQVLTNFGGLTIVPIRTPNDAYCPNTIVFDPNASEGYAGFEPLLGLKLFRLGTQEDDDGWSLVIAENGYVFLGWSGLLFFEGRTFVEAIETTLVQAKRKPIAINRDPQPR